MAAHHIPAMLRPEKPKHTTFGIPVQNNEDPNKPIPGWMDGSNAWCAEVYNSIAPFASGLQSTIAIPAGGYENLIDDVWLAGRIPPLTMQLQGLYGIPYNIFHSLLKDPFLTDGNLIAFIKKLVNARSQQHQYSDYQHDGISAAYAFDTTILLTTIQPPSKLSTAVRGLIHFISDLLDIMGNVRLGSHAARGLGEPAPHQLVHNLMLAGAAP
ncbi:hypothetical protein C2E23DRAFT_882908 [Lenzites betulinus]|nr:hypothetical protein C2E23DRAFT_882908 [Lenzites betulinus]